MHYAITIVITIDLAKFGDRAFSVAGPVVWNSLPAAVRESDIHLSASSKHICLLHVLMTD